MRVTESESWWVLFCGTATPAVQWSQLKHCNAVCLLLHCLGLSSCCAYNQGQRPFFFLQWVPFPWFLDFIFFTHFWAQTWDFLLSSWWTPVTHIQTPCLFYFSWLDTVHLRRVGSLSNSGITGGDGRVGRSKASVSSRRVSDGFTRWKGKRPVTWWQLVFLQQHDRSAGCVSH